MVAAAAPRMALAFKADEPVPLFPYQRAALDAVHERYAAGITKQILQLPTGSGKTLCSVHLTKELGMRTVMIVHRDELAKQTMKQFRDNFQSLSVSLCKADAGRNAWELDTDVVVASAQTLGKPHRLQTLIEAVGTGGFVIADECHHSLADTWRTAIEALNPSLLLGLTATPIRSDGRDLSELYEEVVFQLLVSELVAAGLLARPIGVRIGTTTDLTGIASRAGDNGRDFVQSQLEVAVNTGERNALIVAAWRQHALATGRKRSVAFCVDVAHARDLRDAFLADGVRAAMVSGGTPEDERARIYRDLHEGELQVLTNCMVLTEGFDEPLIDCAMMCRPTQSQGLYIQAVGRSLRKKPEPNTALIMDFVDISQQFGLQTIVALAQDDESVEPPPTGHAGKLVSEQDRHEGEQFDLFATVGERVERRARVRKGAERMGDMLKDSAYQWSASDGGVLVTSIGESRYIAILPSHDGMFRPVEVWGPRNHERPGYRELFSRDLDAETAMGVAAQVIKPSGLVDRMAAWRRRMPTVKQLEAAQKNRIRTDGLTAGEVSDALTLRFFNRICQQAGLRLPATHGGKR